MADPQVNFRPPPLQWPLGHSIQTRRNLRHFHAWPTGRNYINQLFVTFKWCATCCIRLPAAASKSFADAQGSGNLRLYFIGPYKITAISDWKYAKEHPTKRVDLPIFRGTDLPLRWIYGTPRPLFDAADELEWKIPQGALLEKKQKRAKLTARYLATSVRPAVALATFSKMVPNSQMIKNNGMTTAAINLTFSLPSLWLL